MFGFNREYRRLGALRLSILSTVLVYLIIPVGVIVLVAVLSVSRGNKSRPDRRYRPGRPYDFPPIWFLASPDRVGGGATLTAEHDRPAIEAGVLEDSSGAPVRPGTTGGASDSW